MALYYAPPLIPHKRELAVDDDANRHKGREKVKPQKGRGSSQGVACMRENPRCDSATVPPIRTKTNGGLLPACSRCTHPPAHLLPVDPGREKLDHTLVSSENVAVALFEEADSEGETETWLQVTARA